jgi:flagellar biosynthesis GTPase FlhF
MFRKLCGDNTLQNVVIVTNMWGEVDPQVGNDREAELMSEGIFFKPVLDKGARMARHQNTVPSAEDIIRLILDNHPLPLRIQEELVDERKDISETGAGEELNREIKAQIERHQEEIRVLREEMERAIREKDEETRKELEIEMRRMQKEVERFRNDARRLESDYTKEKGMLESRLEQMESEGRQEADRIAARYRQQIDELRTALRSNAETSEREKALLLQQIDELSRRSARAQAAGPAGVGVLSMIGAILDQLLLPAVQRFLPRPSR